MTPPASILTYLVTKTVSTRSLARAIAFALSYPDMPPASVERLGRKSWKVRAVVQDSQLPIAKAYLGDHYGLYTLTT